MNVVAAARRGRRRIPTVPGPQLRAEGTGTLWRRLAAFTGPGYLVAVGYMDPGNWATALAAGSRAGYALLWVVVASSLVAMLLQAAAVRLGIATGMDLAQACRHWFGAPASRVLWVGGEAAIIACNLAEVLGMAAGLHLLFGVPLFAGVCLTVADVLLILGLRRRGSRALEAVIIALAALIAACFALQLWWLKPPLTEVLHGLAPRREAYTDPELLWIALGIVGATVMPHNLYLHSALVNTRPLAASAAARRAALRVATLDSNIALSVALGVNAAILVLAGGVFHRPGAAPVRELGDAYRLLSPLLGVQSAGTVFGLGLMASGLSSSVTGTLAGQVVMEGFLELRIPPLWRALITRALAILPALAVVLFFGGAGLTRLLIASQVVLALQLPFAVGPLLWFTTRRRCLGDFAYGRAMSALLWLTGAAVGVLALGLLLT